MQKIFQRSLVVLFVGAFLVILIAGIVRMRKSEIAEISTGEESDGSATPSVMNTTNSTTATNTATSNNTANANTATTNSTNSSSSQTTTKTGTGQSYDTPWGTLTVQVSIEGTTISAITTPTYPDSPPSTHARSQLIRQAIAANSANIQGVTGATYTSLAFQHSLESAIAKAK